MATTNVDGLVSGLDTTNLINQLMQLERQLRPEAYGRRRGGYVDRRRTPAADA